MLLTHAIVRKPGPNLGDGITKAGLGKPDYGIALRQHGRYVQALEQAGLRVTVLAALDEFPDGHFVEDVAVVTPEVAVIARPGADERRGEEQHIEPVLRSLRETITIAPPGTLDGGDVLIVGRRVFIGISSRTNGEGASQLASILAPYGYESRMVSVGAELHLKSSVNAASENTLLLTRELALREPESGNGPFSGYARIVVDEGDEYAANSLWVNDWILIPLGFPRVLDKLGRSGYSMLEIDVSEMRKMDGGLTCMSLRF